MTEPALPYWIRLEPEEAVLFNELPVRSARPVAYFVTLGLYEVWRRRARFLVTDRRVVAVRGLVSRDQQEIPARMVRSTTVRRSGPGATVWVASTGGALGTQPFGPMGRDQAEAFADAVRRASTAA